MTSAASVKTERITFLGSSGFKSYLLKEAKKEGISLSQLIRQRCEKKLPDDERILAELIKEVRKSTTHAKNTLEKGLIDAEDALKSIRKSIP